MDTKQIINGLLDRADRVADQSAGRIMKRAAKRLEELDAKQRWIPVTERLPKKHIDGKKVLTLNQNKNEHDVWYVEVVQASPHWFTHWMPLPKEVERCELAKNAIISPLAWCKPKPLARNLILILKGKHYALKKSFRPMTNADRIRAMSDEELCDFLGQYSFFEMCDEGCEACSYKGDCDKRLLEWLKQPVKEE